MFCGLSMIASNFCIQVWCFKTPESDQNLQELIVSFRKNLVTGSALLKFSDDDWKEIIQPAGLRGYVRDQVHNIIKKEEKAALSQLHRRGLPKKPVEEKAPLVPQARITSFFRNQKFFSYPMTYHQFYQRLQMIHMNRFHLNLQLLCLKRTSHHLFNACCDAAGKLAKNSSFCAELSINLRRFKKTMFVTQLPNWLLSVLLATTRRAQKSLRVGGRKSRLADRKSNKKILIWKNS